MVLVAVVFFFQAEDGIRDVAVTGVQTCALPIFPQILTGLAQGEFDVAFTFDPSLATGSAARAIPHIGVENTYLVPGNASRSEERRVGKECRSRWSPYH